MTIFTVVPILYEVMYHFIRFFMPNGTNLITIQGLICMLSFFALLTVCRTVMMILPSTHGCLAYFESYYEKLLEKGMIIILI